MVALRWNSLRPLSLLSFACVLLLACGGNNSRPDGGGVADTDGGGGGVDAGGGADGGGGTDGGGGGTDGGGGARMCSAVGGECDVMMQNCPMATQGCYFGRRSMMDTVPTTLCAEAGRLVDGESCMNLNDCAPGFFCDGDSSTCRHYCCGGSSSDCPAGSGQFCISRAGSDIGACTAPSTCTIVPNEGCAAGQGCYIAGADGTLSCFAAGTVADGAACEFLNDCTAGAACLTPMGGAATCTRFCRIAMGMADCGGARTCNPIRLTGLPMDLGTCSAPM